MIGKTILGASVEKKKDSVEKKKDNLIGKTILGASVEKKII